jgi:hypothetical protein
MKKTRRNASLVNNSPITVPRCPNLYRNGWDDVNFFKVPKEATAFKKWEDATPKAKNFLEFTPCVLYSL